MLGLVTMRAVGVVAVTAGVLCGCGQSADRASTSAASSASTSQASVSTPKSAAAREGFGSSSNGLVQPEGMASVPSPEGSTPAGEGQLVVGRIPFTPAPGWEVLSQEEGYLAIATGSPYAERIMVQDFDVDSGLSASLIVSRYLDLIGEKLNWTNVEGEKPTDAGLTGKRFQESAEIQFTADAEDDQGEYQLFGAAIALLNPKTGDAALINYTAFDRKALKANDKDVQAMITSMLD